jgi:H+/Cl- antiporter ClcA
MVTVFSLALALTACLFVMFRPAVGGSGMPQVYTIQDRPGRFNVIILALNDHIPMNKY